MLNFVTVTVSDCVATDEVELQESTLKNLGRYFGYVADSADVLKALD
jgi:hypothetical protein